MRALQAVSAAPKGFQWMKHFLAMLGMFRLDLAYFAR